LHLHRGVAARRRYAKAASLGAWRAAARLVNSSLEDEDWDEARAGTPPVTSGVSARARVVECSRTTLSATVREAV
jgi:hypothetical protein